MSKIEEELMAFYASAEEVFKGFCLDSERTSLLAYVADQLSEDTQSLLKEIGWNGKSFNGPLTWEVVKSLISKHLEKEKPKQQSILDWKIVPKYEKDQSSFWLHVKELGLWSADRQRITLYNKLQEFLGTNEDVVDFEKVRELLQVKLPKPYPKIDTVVVDIPLEDKIVWADMKDVFTYMKSESLLETKRVLLDRLLRSLLETESGQMSKTTFNDIFHTKFGFPLLITSKSPL